MPVYYACTLFTLKPLYFLTRCNFHFPNDYIKTWTQAAIHANGSIPSKYVNLSYQWQEIPLISFLAIITVTIEFKKKKHNLQSLGTLLCIQFSDTGILSIKKTIKPIIRSYNFIW